MADQRPAAPTRRSRGHPSSRAGPRRRRDGRAPSAARCRVAAGRPRRPARRRCGAPGGTARQATPASASACRRDRAPRGRLGARAPGARRSKPENSISVQSARSRAQSGSGAGRTFQVRRRAAPACSSVASSRERSACFRCGGQRLAELAGHQRAGSRRDARRCRTGAMSLTAVFSPTPDAGDVVDARRP